MFFLIRSFCRFPVHCAVSYNTGPFQNKDTVWNLSIALRFPIGLVLSIVCLVVPAWADFKAGMDAYNRGDYVTALREWRPLAEQGDASAQFSLGLSYENGDGVPRDYAKARQWYEKAAAQGDAKAQLYLGMQSSFGQGGPVDLVQAYMWYSLAAGNGNAHAPGYRNDLTRQMTPAQIAEAHKRAREWKPKTP
jgi:TPR repeat protein